MASEVSKDGQSEDKTSSSVTSNSFLSDENIFSFQTGFDKVPGHENTSQYSASAQYPGLAKQPGTILEDVNYSNFYEDATAALDNAGFSETSRDPRQRTQSIEQFLSQSPSHTLGRKRFTGAGAAAGDANSIQHNEAPQQGQRRLSISRAFSSLEFATTDDILDAPADALNDNVNVSLKGLRKGLLALDLSMDNVSPDVLDEQANNGYFGEGSGLISAGSMPGKMPEQFVNTFHDRRSANMKDPNLMRHEHQQPQRTSPDLSFHQPTQRKTEQSPQMTHPGMYQQPPQHDGYVMNDMYAQQQQQYGRYHPNMMYYSAMPPPHPPAGAPPNVDMDAKGYQQHHMPQVQQVVLPNGMQTMVMPVSWMPQQQTMVPMHVPQHFEEQQYEMPPPPRRPQANKPLKTQKQTPNKTSKSRKQDKSIKAVKQDKKEDAGIQGVAISPEEPLARFKGKIFQLSQEQNGCRYLQQKVDMHDEESCTLILQEVRPRLVQLMMDPFGNYLFQKLLEHVTSSQRMEMLKQVKAHVVQAALNLHGTRSVQKFIEICGGSNGKREADLDQLQLLVDSLSPYITKLSMDTNGNHVVQRCLQHMPAHISQFVYDAAERDVLVITRHRHGCCVFQRCIDAASAKQRKALVQKVIEHSIQLMQDPFGNYVVQYVLDNAQQDETNALIMQLTGMLAQLSMQKFSSNVVEKCLLTAPAQVREPMIIELANPATMRNLLHDQFANYVVQRALLVADDEQGMALVNSIRPHITDLGQFNPSCARRVTSRVIKRFPALTSDPLFVPFCPGE